MRNVAPGSVISDNFPGSLDRVILMLLRVCDAVSQSSQSTRLRVFHAALAAFAPRTYNPLPNFVQTISLTHYPAPWIAAKLRRKWPHITTNPNDEISMNPNNVIRCPWPPIDDPLYLA